MVTMNRAIEDAAEYVGMMEKIMSKRGYLGQEEPQRAGGETRTQRRARERAELKAAIKATKETA